MNEISRKLKEIKMITTVLYFIFGLVLLIKGGDWFVDGATGIAHRFHIPEILIGATVVSIGTTLPEVMVSATSAIGGHGEIAYGNAIGSIICNTALIAAITIAIKPGKIEKASLKNPVLFFFTASLFCLLNVYVFGGFSRISGIVLLSLFLIYMSVTVLQMRKLPQEKNEKTVEEEEKPLHKSLFLLVLGAVLIAWGADLLVNNGILIAEALGVPESVIALTFVALGTSLPELVTAITSLMKGHGALSLGNVIGANLFNLVLVMGASVTFAPFAIPQNSMVFGINSSLIIDIPVMLLVMGLLTIPPFIKGRLYRWQGIMLLLIYTAFCILQFII